MGGRRKERLCLALGPGVAFRVPRVLLVQERANIAKYARERGAPETPLALQGLPVSGTL